jgi:hypothetical protein
VELSLQPASSEMACWKVCSTNVSSWIERMRSPATKRYVKDKNQLNHKDIYDI